MGKIKNVQLNLVRKKIGKVKTVEQANIIFTSFENVEAKASPSRKQNSEHTWTFGEI